MTGVAPTFVWGLKRSGIHLVVGWLYANLGGRVKGELVTDGLHPQLCDGFADREAGVAFFNNCGRQHSRRFELGDLTGEDIDRAARSRRATIFGIEDCPLREADRFADVAGSNLLVLRDPLNNLASRLEAGRTRPEVFRVDAAYVELLDGYCAEALGRTHQLPHKVVVNYNTFVVDRAYRDTLAAALGLVNVDDVAEVSAYGGGSSFPDGSTATSELMTRFRQHPIPAPLIDLLVGRPAIVEACRELFHYDLAEHGRSA